MMKNCKKPCDQCTQPVCDYRRCPPYRRWLHETWKQFNRHVRCGHGLGGGRKPGKFTYIHPDLIRDYLEKGPCFRCQWADDCDLPCMAYWNWWDDRMAWLRWKLRPAGT